MKILTYGENYYQNMTQKAHPIFYRCRMRRVKQPAEGRTAGVRKSQNSIKTLTPKPVLFLRGKTKQNKKTGCGLKKKKL